MEVLLIIVALCWFFTPFFIMSKIGDLSERLERFKETLEEKLTASERRLQQTLEEILRGAPGEPQTREAAVASPFVPAMPPSASAPSTPEILATPIPEISEKVFEPEVSAPAIHESEVPLEPEVPGVLELALRRFLSWMLAEGNVWVCAGALLFFVGFGLLFRYALQLDLLTLEMRLAAAALTGIAMVWFGFHIRERRRVYALILQGGGMGVLYLVVLGAARLNASGGLPILSPAFSAAAMLVLSVFTVLLAWLQDYEPLALFAVMGGFAAPILVSVSSRNYVALFSIYTLLNFEVLALTFKRNWRLLNRAAFIITIAVGTAWGFRDWRPELFASVEPFLVIFLVTYTLVAAARGDGTRSPDIFLALGAPSGFFLLQMKAAEHLRYGMALTCLGLGLWHLLLGAWPRRPSRALSRLHMALSILFSNLVIPYTFDNTISSAAWAAEGAFLVGAASRWGSHKALLAGLALHAGALYLYGPEISRLDLSAAARLSPLFISGVLFAASCWLSGFWVSRFRLSYKPSLKGWEGTLKENVGKWGSFLSWSFTILGSLWWWYTIYDQISRLDVNWLFPAACLTALAGSWLSVKLDWKAARFLLLCPIASVLAWTPIGWSQLLGVTMPFFRNSFLQTIGENAWVNSVAYVVSIGGSLWLLRGTATFFSPVTLFIATWSGLPLIEGAARQMGLRFGHEWGPLFSLLPFFGLLLLLRRFSEKEEVFRRHRTPLTCATGMELLFLTWSFVRSFSSAGSAVQELFIPLLNPLELWQALILFSLAVWRQIFAVKGQPAWPKWTRQGSALLLFVWLNQVTARGVWWHLLDRRHYDMWEVAFTSEYQAVIAIVWGVLGLWAVLWGQKFRSRTLWFSGSGLLSIDVAKLLLVDLQGAATLTRILAFLVLGGLFLLIGWVAPLPPKEDAQQNKGETPS
ncbi:MAG: DUF2339 domain-containing protein [Synergistaceae bacterium]|nr:DUF2339 domain-containing protein [Synergistaceae bacterium]